MNDYIIRLDLLAYAETCLKLEVVVFSGLKRVLKLLNPPIQKEFEQVMGIKWSVGLLYLYLFLGMAWNK